MQYKTEGKNGRVIEYIEGENYKSEEYPLYTLLLRFFDLIVDDMSSETVYNYLQDLRCDEVSYEKACEYLPLFRLVNPDSNYYKMELIDLFEFYENGRQVLSEIFYEQRENEETLYKTLYIRSLNADTATEDKRFFSGIDLRNVRFPAETIWEFFICCFDRLASEDNRSGGAAVYIGQCEKCFSHYPIRRVKHGALAKNRFCDKCRNTMSALLTRETKKQSPLYTEYQKIYNKYYQRFKRLEKLTYEQFKDATRIAGTIRDEYIAQGNEDGNRYMEEVEKKIKEWLEM